MLFNSYAFLLAFLPITWLVYFGLNKIRLFRFAQAALIAASFIFYGYENWRLCLLLAFSIALNYVLHCFLMDDRLRPVVRKLLLTGGLAANFTLLFYCKYLDFTITNINLFFGTSFALRHIALPLGISFYTFQQVSFLVDSYRREMGKYRIWDYALFVCFFPQLVAGPIVLHKEILPQFMDLNKKHIDYGNMISGIEYLILGLSKKVLLADVFGRMTEYGFNLNNPLNSISAIAVILAYTLEIYFDFSGYCDMAVGIGRLFNIDIPVNFRSPYKAVNISEFWKRWHITLTRFLTTYLYIPLGGNRKGKWRTCLNVMIVFTLSGLWHGADWNFVAWGMLHGLMMVFYRLNKEWIDRLPRLLSWGMTFVFINMAWVFFGTTGLSQPFQLYHMVFAGGIGGLASGITDAVCLKNSILIVLRRFIGEGTIGIISQVFTAFWLLGGTCLCLKAPSTHEIVAEKHRGSWYFLGLAVLFFWSVMKLSEVSKFIYFNF